MQNSSNLLYNVERIRALEKIAMQYYQISIDALMERAGIAAFRELKEYWPSAKNIVVVCGKGNNAGDGYVIARLAHEAKLNVLILNLTAVETLRGAALNAARECEKLNIQIQPFSVDKLQHADIVVDAIFGTGLTGEVQDYFQSAIHAINSTKIPVLAVDLPSGLNADNGKVLGAAIVADLTVTFIAKKTGLYSGEGRDHCGRILSDDLELPTDIFKQVDATAKLLDYHEQKANLPKRKSSAHKNNFGHVLVIGGDYGMAGAVRMTGEAALRVGAGIVTIATRPAHVGAINSARPELMCHGIKYRSGLDGLIERATCVVIGPGLGKSSWGKRLLHEVLSFEKPLILDADALNLLSQNPLQKNNWILTPHPGEASRLLNCKNETVQDDRILAVQLIARKYGGICVLKGAGTLVAAANDLIGLCNVGNPGMATAGMGDILSGIIGGLVAQKLSLYAAANLGVLVHATAGDLVAKEFGERGMLALDLLAYVRQLIN